MDFIEYSTSRDKTHGWKSSYSRDEMCLSPLHKSYDRCIVQRKLLMPDYA